MKSQTSWTIRFCVSLLFAVMIAGCASTATRESTGEFIDDSVITANVKSVIYNDPDLKIGQISVETYKGVVQLSGFVNSTAAVAKAGQLASSVKGVVSVKNSLVLK
ncbi:MAG: transporter [Desulfobacterales bacterium GWB2_56_26]|nr:MAG: transporter [Desulfobacterales bacterium GWB2_56_26]